MSMSMRETIVNNTREDIATLMRSSLKKPNAAVGQSGLQALYETMFRNYGILIVQVLVIKPDFFTDQTRQQLFTTIDELLQLNIIPIINTNDAISPPPQKEGDEDGVLNIKDSNLLAVRAAAEARADLAILMSDVDGICNRPPGKPASPVVAPLASSAEDDDDGNARVRAQHLQPGRPAQDRARPGQRLRHRRHEVQGERCALGPGERHERSHLQRHEVQRYPQGDGR